MLCYDKWAEIPRSIHLYCWRKQHHASLHTEWPPKVKFVFTLSFSDKQHQIISFNLYNIGRNWRLTFMLANRLQIIVKCLATTFIQQIFNSWWINLLFNNWPIFKNHYYNDSGKKNNLTWWIGHDIMNYYLDSNQ